MLSDRKKVFGRILAKMAKNYLPLDVGHRNLTQYLDISIVIENILFQHSSQIILRSFLRYYMYNLPLAQWLAALHQVEGDAPHALRIKIPQTICKLHTQPIVHFLLTVHPIFASLEAVI